jgi:hypothetical protein
MGDPGRRYTDRETDNQSQGRSGAGMAKVKEGVIRPKAGNATSGGGINRATKPGRKS